MCGGTRSAGGHLEDAYVTGFAISNLSTVAALFKT